MNNVLECLINILNDPEFEQKCRFCSNFCVDHIDESNADEYFSYLAYAAGYTSLPTAIPNGEYKFLRDVIGVPLFRGADDIELHKELILNEHYNTGHSKGGSGLYFAIAKKETRRLKRKFSKNAIIIEGVLASDSQVIPSTNLSLLETEMNYINTPYFNIKKFGNRQAIINDISQIISQGIIDKNKLLKLIHCDPSKLALILGYDAIISKENPLKNPEEVDELTLLNRGKLMINPETLWIMQKTFEK